MFHRNQHPNDNSAPRKSKLGFLHRNRSANTYNDANAPKQHTWTASSTQAELNQYPSSSSSSSTTSHRGLGGLFGRGGHRGVQRSSSYGNEYDNRTSYSDRDMYYDRNTGISQSDWDHYAVRHEDALIGDPIPYADNSMNGPLYGPYGYRNFGWGNGPYVGPEQNVLPHDASGFVHNAPGRYPNANPTKPYTDREMHKWGPGPVVADLPVDGTGRPVHGNYSSGTLIENTGFPNRYGTFDGKNVNRLNDPNFGYDEGYRYRSRGTLGNETFVDGGLGETVTTTSYQVGNNPPVTTTNVSGKKSRFGGWFGSSAEPLWGDNNNNNYREFRDTATPLLPDNPWTHNELSREYIDSRQTLNGLPPANRRQTFNGPMMNNNAPVSSTTTVTRTYSPVMGRNSPMMSRSIPVPPPLPPVYVPHHDDHYRLRQGNVHFLGDSYDSSFARGYPHRNLQGQSIQCGNRNCNECYY